ncbi:MAG TPA: hypothetical protein ENJ48_02810 [Anaerolineae bacterium]|nr:hypothetical protein [Anaerolineae bacterium]
MKKIAFGFMIAALAMTACIAPKPPATATPTVPTATATFTATATPLSPTPTPVPTATPIPPSPTPTPTPVPPDTAELSAQLMAALYPAGVPAAGDTSASVQGVEVVPLKVAAGSQPLWAAFSVGRNGYLPEEPKHFVAIFSHNSDGWQQLASLELTDPDYLGDRSFQQVFVEPEHIWLQMEGGAGAHSGIFDLIMFDGQSLSLKLSGFSAGARAGQTVDLDGDGVLEVVLDATDYYVFCYACNVRLPMFQVYRWNGSELIAVELTALGEDAPANLRDANNRMVALAQAWLWKDALSAMDAVQAIGSDDETVAWNVRLVKLNTDSLTEEIGVSSYPLLAYIFFGDYDGALDMMRQYPAEKLFSAQSPLVADTPAEGWESTLRDWIFQATDLALSEEPNLAAAHFLRGWAAFISDGETDEVRAEIAQVVSLAPDEPLFKSAQQFLGE